VADNSADAGKRRNGPGRPFKPGQSGNPGGAPKRLAELSASIREFDNELRDRLLEIARSDSAKDAREAIKLLWAYAHGNPRQVVTDGEGNAVNFGVVFLPAKKLLADE
jgi:hypothetical protein